MAISAPTEALCGFVERTEKTLIESCRFVRPELSLERHEAFLRKVGRRSTRLPRMKLFTTNYDTAFEVAASRTHGPRGDDGFTHFFPIGMEPPAPAPAPDPSDPKRPGSSNFAAADEA